MSLVTQTMLMEIDVIKAGEEKNKLLKIIAEEKSELIKKRLGNKINRYYSRKEYINRPRRNTFQASPGVYTVGNFAFLGRTRKFIRKYKLGSRVKRSEDEEENILRELRNLKEYPIF